MVDEIKYLLFQLLGAQLQGWYRIELDLFSLVRIGSVKILDRT